MPLDTSITLSYTTRQTEKGTTSLTFKATGYQISSAVFAIEVLPKSAEFEAPSVRFSHVCSFAELTEFPEQEPGDCAYYRVSEIELVFDNPSYVEHVVANMQHDVMNLVREALSLEESPSSTITVTYDGTNVLPQPGGSTPSGHIIYAVTVDNELSPDSQNPVANSVITQAFENTQPLIDNAHKLPYSFISDAPVIGNGTVTIRQGDVEKARFTLNQQNSIEINLDAGGGSGSEQVQADWAETDTESKAYIQHKPTIPTVNNGTITLTQGGVSKGSFTTNQSDDLTIDLDAGGGGGGTDERPVVEVIDQDTALEPDKAYKITATGPVTISLTDNRSGYENFYTAELIANGGTFTLNGITLINPIRATAKNYVGIHWDGTSAFLYNYRWETLA